MMKCFNYPIDSGTILRKKKALKRMLLNNCIHPIEKNIAILGGSTTSEIKDILELFLLKNSIKPNFYESGFNQFHQDALFGNEKLNEFKPDIIYIHTTNVNIERFPSISDSDDEINELFNSEIAKFRHIWASLNRFNCAIIQNNFDLPINRGFGSLDFYDPHGKVHFINRLNWEFAKSAGEIKNLYINDINYLSSFVGLTTWFDKKLWYVAKYAVNYEAIPILAHSIAMIINSIFGKSKKCLIVDLDNTCWGGIIGDDGLGGIQLGPGIAGGEAYCDFQRYLKDLKQRGVVLAVCSKNDIENAREGFTHPESILSYGDFSVFKANWDPKPQNIVEIIEELNIGLDSCVFIDDNPVERENVSTQLLGVSVPDVEGDIVNFIDHIDNNGFFEIVSLSAEDLNRNKYYEENIKRNSELQQFEDVDSFLSSLDMTADIKRFSSFYLERITQLINKTNQFNLTTKRYSYSEIEAILSDETKIGLYGKLTDKFGDNGLISVVLTSIKNMECHVDLWVMSCRVFNRGMEYAMFEALVKECRLRGLKKIIGYYYPTEKNKIVANLYGCLGFVQIDKSAVLGKWELELNNYNQIKNFIKVESE